MSKRLLLAAALSSAVMPLHALDPLSAGFDAASQAAAEVKQSLCREPELRELSRVSLLVRTWSPDAKDSPKTYSLLPASCRGDDKDTRWTWVTADGLHAAVLTTTPLAYEIYRRGHDVGIMTRAFVVKRRVPASGELGAAEATMSPVPHQSLLGSWSPVLQIDRANDRSVRVDVIRPAL